MLLLLLFKFGIFSLTIINGYLTQTIDDSSEMNSLSISVFLPKDKYLNPFYDPLTEELLSMDTNYTTYGKEWDTKKTILKRSISSKSSKKKTKTNDGLYRQEKIDQLKNQIVIDSQWEELITAGPVTINLLGQLIILSSSHDIDLKESQPNYYEFIYMKHPQSFSATLIQISNEGWEAFFNAHKNMDRIQSYMKQIPGYVQTSLKLYAKGTPRLIQRLLPKSLASIERIGNECIKLASETDKKFYGVMQLITEVIQVTTTSHGVHKQRVKNITRKINITTVAQVQISERADQYKEKYEKENEYLKKTQHEFSEALKRIPTGFDAIFQDLGRMAVNIGNAVANTLAASAGLIKTFYNFDPKSGVGGAFGRIIPNNVPALQVETVGTLAMMKTFSEQIDRIVTKLNESINNSIDLSSELDAYKMFHEGLVKSVQLEPDNKNKSVQLGPGNSIKSTQLGPDNKIKSEALSLLESCTNLIDETLEHIKITKNIKTISSKIKSKWENLQQRLKPILAVNEFVNGSPPPKPTNQSEGNNDQYRNEKYKAEQYKEMMKHAQQEADQYFNKWMENKKKLTELSMELAGLDITRVDYQTIIELLSNALTLLGNLKEEWSKLVIFFTLITKRADIELNESLRQFLSHTRDAVELGDASAKVDREIYSDTIKAYTKTIHREAHVLYVMSKTYVDMSNDLIMSQLAGLSKLLNAGTPEEKKRLSNILKDNIYKIQENVSIIVKKRREKYKKEVDEQINQLDQMIEKMGGHDPEDLKHIEDGKNLLLNEKNNNDDSSKQDKSKESEDESEEEEKA